LEVERTILYDVSNSAEANNRIICSIGKDTLIRGNAIRSLGPAELANRDIFDGLLTLFTLRDRKIEEATNDVNVGKRNYVPYRKSFYYGAKAFEELMNDSLEFYRSYSDAIAPDTYRIYFAIEIKKLNSYSWQLIIIDFAKQCFYHLDPSRNTGSQIECITLQVCSEEHNSVSYTGDEIKESLNFLLRLSSNIEVTTAWRFAVSDLFVRIEINEDDFSDGVYVLAFIYYISCDLPLLISRNEVQALRRKWIHWLLIGALPT
jgi:hypothetical protein